MRSGNGPEDSVATFAGAASYVQPFLGCLLLIILICALRCWARQRGRTTGILLLSTLALFFLSWGPAAWLISRPFECWYPIRAFPEGEAEAIVVLSSNVLPPAPERPFSLPDRETYERCQYAAWLHTNWRRLPILASGGVGVSGGAPYASTMRRILQGEGVSESMIWTEEMSHSTHESAIYAADLFRSKGVRKVVLVTHAYHMLRSEKCFRKVGLDVLTAPCGFRKLDLQPGDLLPGWKAIYQNERSLHEAMGLFWYSMRGWI